MTPYLARTWSTAAWLGELPLSRFMKSGGPCFWKSFSRWRATASPLDLDGHERLVAVLGAEVLDHVDVEAVAPCPSFAPFRSVDGPGKVRLLQVTRLLHLPALADLARADLGDHFGHRAAGDALGIAGLEEAQLPWLRFLPWRRASMSPAYLLQGQGSRLLWSPEG